jgi:uncharacterized protein YecT (DUF1311 family)
MTLIRCARCAFLFSIATLVLPQICTAQQKKKVKSCWETALTQSAMNECAGQDLRAVETRLNNLLKKLGIGADDQAQKAWESYRDAQLEAIYPRENIGDYGSVYPMCLAKLRARLVEGRIRDLKALTWSGEGEVCSGLKAVAQGRADIPSVIRQKTAAVPAGRNLSSVAR